MLSVQLPTGVKILTVARRFCGPPTSANGGYFAGLVAALSPTTVTVRLRAPPPLDAALAVTTSVHGGVEIRCGDALIADSLPAALDLTVPPPVDRREAVEASRHYIGFKHHRFPTCFVCGPERVRGDGLCIYAGAVPGRDVVAAPWIPDESLDRGDGHVRPEFMSAALDCPGYFAVTPDDRMMLLGQFTVEIGRPARIGERCTVMGWAIGSAGRKHEAGTVLRGEDGEICGCARAMWIEPRPGS